MCVAWPAHPGQKLSRESIRLSQIQDIAGCRIVVQDTTAQEEAVAAICRLFPDATEITDRRISPSHGYRAVHVVVRVLDRRVEVQIRTALQHEWAELSEKLADVHDTAIKYGGGSRLARDLLMAASEAVADLEAREGELARDLRPAVGERLRKQHGDAARAVAMVLRNLRTEVEQGRWKP